MSHVILIPALLGALAAARTVAAPLENLAPKAKAAATSEFSADYVARFAIDGKIPGAMSRADVGKAWAVQGTTHGGGAALTLQWPRPVTIAEVVYYGRTAWEWVENWKDYELYLDDAGTPVAKGRLKPGHGPQRIKLPRPTRAAKLTLKFLSSYGGSNPGASEIRVYPASPPDKLLGPFTPAQPKAAGRRTAPVRELPESAELAAALKQGKLGFDRLLVLQRHVLNPTHVYTYHCEGFRGGGGLFVLDVAAGELHKLVDAGGGQMIDYDLSHDGRTVLFSWRRGAKSTYQLFTVSVAGGEPKQLTDGEHHNYNGCWLPDGDVAFLSTRKSQYAYCWTSPVGILYRMKPDGSDVRRISANYLNDFTPSVTNDGQIIYGRWEYVDRPAIPIQSLWTLNPDGTGLAVFYGNRVLSPATFIEPRAIPGSPAILCTLTAHNGPCRGAIGIIDAIHGVNAQAAIRNLTPEVNIGRVDKGSGNHVRGPYENPYPLDGERFLVSRGGTILLRDYDGTKQAALLAPRGGMGFYNPRPVRPRPRPPVRPSHLPPAGEADAWATLYLQDVYNGLEPHVKRGDVVRVAVVQEIEKPRLAQVSLRAFGFQFPVVSCGATYAPKKLWGFADVAADGSAAFRVPAGVPIYFMALDAEGRALQRMRSFTHLMPGEVQGCVGCHESRTQNAHGFAHPAAFAGKPQELKEPEWGATGFSYAHVVQPVLDKHCVRCHNAADRPGGLDLSGDLTDFFNVSYEHLARQGNPGDNPYTKWIPTYNGREANILEITPGHWGSPASKLAEVVRSGHPDARGQRRVKVDDAGRRRLFAWIDLNVPYYGTSRSNHYGRRGCRQMVPPDLEKVLQDVAQRRCASCHKADRRGRAGIPRRPWTRITRPERNGFLLAPLAARHGGTEACGRAVFESPDDPDYRAILATFEPITKLLQAQPRMDMRKRR